MGFTWPDFFPDGCPPEGSGEAEGIYYRFVRGNPPQIADFTSKREQGKFPHHRVSAAEICIACGLSLFKDRSDAMRMQQYRGIYRNYLIARGRLGGGHGRIARTGGGSHHTWWIPNEIQRDDPACLFRVLEGD